MSLGAVGERPAGWPGPEAEGTERARCGGNRRHVSTARALVQGSLATGPRTFMPRPVHPSPHLSSGHTALSTSQSPCEEFWKEAI